MEATLRYVAPCQFGLEGILAGELRRMDARDVLAENGRVLFSGGLEILARANLCLRTAERVQILLGEFTAKSFEELYQGMKAIPLEEFIGKADRFPVKGYSLNSTLHSVPDCQSILKKAAVDRLKQHYRIDWFPEKNALCQLQFSILKDRVSILLDTSGPGLHKRGWRAHSNAAPIKETLAAGIVDCARVKGYSIACDPFCGSGTLIIEAAGKALNIPPCLRRRFAAQEFGFVPESVWQQERTRGLDLIRRDAEFHGYAWDLDPNCVELTMANAKKAGLGKRITVEQRDIKDFSPLPKGITLCNPPYGERMLDQKQARSIYRTMGKVFTRAQGEGYYIITPDLEFPQCFGHAPDKQRKLYNGMLKCYLYQYFKPVPERSHGHE